jgi:hypothetical protein
MSSFSFKAAILLPAIVCLSIASARADSFKFKGSASLGGDSANFFISGPSFKLYSGAPGGPTDLLFTCEAGKICEVPAFSIFAFPSPPSEPGNFSGGTVNGITAYALMGSLDFSPSSILVPSNLSGGFPWKGRVTYTGHLQGFVFLPLGCEASSTCDSLGPEVFDIFLSGTGTVTTRGQFVGEGEAGFFQVDYKFSSSPTPIPEPSSLWLVGSGLAGLVGLWRRRVNS